MVDWKNKYLEMKLKYINAKIQLKGGYASLDLSRAKPEDRFHDQMHPHGNKMHSHEHEHRILDDNDNLVGPYKNEQSHWILDPHSHKHESEQHSHNFKTQSRQVKKSNSYIHDHSHFDVETNQYHTGKHLHTKRPKSTEKAHNKQGHYHKFHRDENNLTIPHNINIQSRPSTTQSRPSTTQSTPSTTQSTPSTQSGLSNDNIFRGKDVSCTNYHNQPRKCGSIPNCQYTSNNLCKARKDVRSGKNEFQGPLNKSTETSAPPVPPVAPVAPVPPAPTQSRPIDLNINIDNLLNVSEPSTYPNDKDPNTLTVPHLRYLLKKKGLSQQGNRQELIHRLTASSSSNISTQSTQSTTNSSVIADDRRTENCKNLKKEIECGSNPGCNWDKNREPKCKANWGTKKTSGKKQFQGPIRKIN